MSAPLLPTINAGLNGLATVCLFLGWRAIRHQQRDRHRNWMIAALAASAVFLTCYLVYHARAGSTPYPHHDWTRPVYYTILAPHILLAALMVPFIFTAVWFAARRQFEWHARITRRLWPVWMFVSVTGVMIYLMLYRP